MRFWRRKKTSQQAEPEGAGQQAWGRSSDGAEAITGVPVTPTSAPGSAFEPKVDPSTERIYEDELDPSWRDPETGDPETE